MLGAESALRSEADGTWKMSIESVFTWGGPLLLRAPELVRQFDSYAGHCREQMIERSLIALPLISARAVTCSETTSPTAGWATCNIGCKRILGTRIAGETAVRMSAVVPSL
jgi:hypothetical protein